MPPRAVARRSMAARARHFLSSAVAGLLALACTLGPAISPAAAETATGTVLVHVRGSDGDPAVRVFVSTRNETGSDSPYGYTDESGSIRFDGLAEGRYQLSLRCYANCPTSYVAQTTDWFDVADGQHLERDVELALGASIDGRVIGDDGRALADALVRLHPMSTAPLPHFETSMRTGMDGRYRFTDLPAGDYTVEFLPDGTLAIQTDCNRAMGNYAVTGAQLELRIGGVTRMACPPGSLMDPFLADLARAVSYTIQQTLTLALAGDGVMQFTAVVPAPAAATPEAG